MALALASPSVEFALSRSGSYLDVTEVFVGRPGEEAAYLPGAFNVEVPASQVAIVHRTTLAIPDGETRAEVSYEVPFPASGLSVVVPVPTPTKLVFVLEGPGVTFPVILNQAFFGVGTQTGLGETYTVFVAKGFSKPFRLNIESDTSVPGLGLEWLWVLPFVAIGLYLLARLRRRRA